MSAIELGLYLGVTGGSVTKRIRTLRENGTAICIRSYTRVGKQGRNTPIYAIGTKDAVEPKATRKEIQDRYYARNRVKISMKRYGVSNSTLTRLNNPFGIGLANVKSCV